MDLNQVSLIGNVGKDPEVRTLQSGGRVVSFSLATNRSWVDKASNERKQITQWHQVTTFNEGLGDVIMRFVQKGSRVFLQGEVQYRKWTDKDGVERWSTDILLPNFEGKLILLSGGKQAGGDNDSGGNPRAPRSASAPKPSAEFDDDIPF